MMSDSPKFSIFIVDDDQEMIDYMADLLVSAGHDVTTSTDSTAAIAEIIAKKPDCVVCDLMMPGLDGMEVCNLLRKESESDYSVLEEKTSRKPAKKKAVTRPAEKKTRAKTARKKSSKKTKKVGEYLFQ